MSGGGLLGGLFGGGSSQTTQSTTSQPWDKAQPALTRGLNSALAVFNRDPSGKNSVYTGSTVVPWDKQTLAGQNIITGAANANMGGKGLSGQYQGIIDSGGYNGAQQDALGNTRALANSQYSISPELQRVLDTQATKVTDSVNSGAAGAGRYGSGANQNLLAQNIGDLTNQTVLSDYTNFLGRRDAANGNLFNMGQQGVGNLGTAYSGMQAPAQSLMQVGAMNEDLATRQMNDKLRVFQAKNDAPWNQISRLNAIASGAGQLGSTQTQSAPGQNPFLTAAGYGLTGAGLLGGMGMF